MLHSLQLDMMQILNSEHLGQVWTHQSGLFKLWIWIVKQEKNLIKTEVASFLPKFLNSSKHYHKDQSKTSFSGSGIILKRSDSYSSYRLNNRNNACFWPALHQYSQTVQITAQKLTPVFVLWFGTHRDFNTNTCVLV